LGLNGVVILVALTLRNGRKEQGLRAFTELQASTKGGVDYQSLLETIEIEVWKA
jgi:hypothetical protein